MEYKKDQNETLNRQDDLKISFQPITEGLGFHPFSDGLPYAPSLKTTKSSMKSSKERFDVPPFVLNQKANAEVQAPRPTQIVKQVKQDSGFGYLYLVKRFSAYLLDFLINSLVLTSILISTLWLYDLDPKLMLDSSFLLVGIAVLTSLNWFLITLQEIVFQTSMGKNWFRLVIPASRVRLFFRALFFLPSIGMLGVGILWSLFDSKKMCLHDRFFNVQPIEF